MANELPLLYRKLSEFFASKPEWDRKQFRKNLGRYGVTKEDWVPITSELTAMGVISVKRKKIVIVGA